jgi:serine/threonine-protein kinase
MAQLLQPKQKLAGYEILELVGKGGMGEVYRARQISMERIVALKILAPRLAKQDPSFARRFVEEARAAGRLNNPNIIAVHDVGKAPMPGDPDSELDYFSMEFVDGESVKDVIERQGGCPLSLVGQVMLGMSEALVYAEAQGIVHRDIKPDNIMLTNGGVVKLADLGLALQLGGEEGLIEKDEKGRGKVMGTPLYMSPEQARALPVDSRSDQYSLGATLYHMLTGKPPYRGENAKAIMKSHVFDPVPDPKAINPDVPEPWRQLSMKLMAKNPEERFPSCVELREMVQAAISGQSSPGPSRRVRAAGWVSSVERTAGMPGWAKMLVYAFAASVVALVAVFIPGGGHGSAGDPPKQPDTVVAPPPPNPQARAMERVQAALKGLPPDPDKAMAQVDALLADQTLPPGPARERLAQEAARRKGEIELARKARDEQQAKQRLVRVDEMQKAMAAGNLMQVKEGLQALSGELDKLPAAARDSAARIKQQFQLALVDVQKQFSDRMLQAKRREEVDAALAEAKASPLGDEAISALGELAGKRGGELGKGGGGAEDRAQWLELSDQLDPLRCAFINYKKVRGVVESEAPKFPADSRELVKVLGDIGEQALLIEKVLRKYMGDTQRPPVDIVVGGKTLKAKLNGLTGTNVTFLAQDPGAEEQILERRLVGLPLKDIIDHIQADFYAVDVPNAADRPRAILAYLWFWRQPEAGAMAAKMSSEPLAKAIAILESKTHVLDLRGRTTRVGRQVTVSYDFTQKRTDLLEDFAGEGLSSSPNGLSWSTNKVTPTFKGFGAESDLPTLRWKEALLPPISISALCYLHPASFLALLGVTAGGRSVRIGFNTLGTVHRVMTLVTRADGVNFEVGKKAWDKVGARPYFKAVDQVKIDITVSAEGKVTVKFNDNAVGDEVQLVLPADKPASLIVQSLLHDEGEGGMDINQLTISGMLPESR